MEYFAEAGELPRLKQCWATSTRGTKNENTSDSDNQSQFYVTAPTMFLPKAGGAEFHTVKYWSEGGGGYSPYVPEVPISGFDLRIIPPETGNLFTFAQPVYLTLAFTNQTQDAYQFSDDLLDPKGGFLEILIERMGIADEAHREVIRFRPVINRLYDIDFSTAEVVQPGAIISRNINITFGSAGFTFAEPGNYRITALLAFYDSQNQRELIIKSTPLDIRIAHPKNMNEEREALDIFTRDVGLYFVLGGSDELTQAEDKLQAICERRQGKQKIISDPLVVYFHRTRALNLAREFIFPEKGKFSIRASDPEAAANLIQPLTDAKKLFDHVTWSGTHDLLKNLIKMQEG